MIDAGRLLTDTRAQVVALVDSLRTVAATDDGAQVAEGHRRTRAAGRTALGPAKLADGLYAQVAAAWALRGVFVRNCEDNELIADPLLGGPGGSTCPENTCLLCRRHHTRLHRPGWSATLAADGELVVTDPDGRAHTSRPPDHGPRPPPALFAA